MNCKSDIFSLRTFSIFSHFRYCRQYISQGGFVDKRTVLSDLVIQVMVAINYVVVWGFRQKME